MGKYDSYIIQKILFFKVPLLSFTVKNYYAALKSYDSAAVDSSNDEDEMIDYLSESSGSEADW